MKSKMSMIARFFWLYAFVLLAMMACVKVSTVDRAIRTEFHFVTGALGENSARYVYGKAADWYQTIAVDWGLHDGMRRLFIPDEEERENSKGMETFGNYIFRWWSDRMEAFWRGLYMLFSRIWILLLWLPFVPFFIFAAINDGWQIRNIKRTNFDYASPARHHYAVTAISWIMFILLVLVVSPLPMNPLIYPIMLGVCGVMVAFSVANIQKRL